MERPSLALGSLSGGLAVALVAFGAHALQNQLSADALASFETRVRYQMCHGLALLAAAWAMSRRSGSLLSSAAGWLFVADMLLFSVSLFVFAFSGRRWLGATTPLGGA